MASLLPTDSLTPITEIELTSSEIKYGKGWKFDYDKMDFISSPTGKIVPASGLETFMEWCQKSLLTSRYKYMIYTSNYGNEYEDLLGKGYSKTIIESEIKRMTIEALIYDPRTLSVGNFTFSWLEDGVYFMCEIVSTYGESFQVSRKVVM